MTAAEGYVWFLPAWFTHQWWQTDKLYSHKNFNENVPCTSAEMLEAVQAHFFFNTAFLGQSDSAIVGNCTVRHWYETYLSRMEELVREDVFNLL